MQLGRLQSGEPAAVIKAERRVRIGSRRLRARHGAVGRGRGTRRPSPTTEQVRELATEYKPLVIATLQRRDAWQVIDTVNRITDPSTLADLAGYAP